MTYSVGNITVSIPTLAIPPMPMLTHQFASDNRHVVLAENVKDDIFCASEESARSYNCSLSINACQRCQLTGNTEANIFCHCRPSPWRNIFANRNNSLPVIVDNVRIHGSSSRDVSASVHHVSAPILIRVEQLRLVGSTNESICHISFYNLTGCYSCDSGARLTVGCYTDFGSSLAQIECPSFNTVMQCQGNTTDIAELVVGLTTAQISESCSVRCPGGHSTFDIKGLLHYVPHEYSAPLAETLTSEQNETSVSPFT
jgi:hypothetical protein